MAFGERTNDKISALRNNHWWDHLQKILCDSRFEALTRSWMQYLPSIRNQVTLRGGFVLLNWRVSDRLCRKSYEKTAAEVFVRFGETGVVF